MTGNLLFLEVRCPTPSTVQLRGYTLQQGAPSQQCMSPRSQETGGTELSPVTWESPPAQKPHPVGVSQSPISILCLSGAHPTQPGTPSNGAPQSVDLPVIEEGENLVSHILGGGNRWRCKSEPGTWDPVSWRLNPRIFSIFICKIGMMRLSYKGLETEIYTSYFPVPAPQSYSSFIPLLTWGVAG